LLEIADWGAIVFGKLFCRQSRSPEEICPQRPLNTADQQTFYADGR
jgi:hypothetical protein